MARIIDQATREYNDGYVAYWPAILECDCGNHLELSDGLDNTCDKCGRNYNMSGQLVMHSRDPRVEEPYDEDY